MPKYYKKRNFKKKRNPLFKKVANTNSMYRRSVPRTLQIADRRNKSQVLRFVTNQTYHVKPGGNVGGVENCYLTIQANSLFNIMTSNGSAQSAGTWHSQDATSYGVGVSPNATGWDEWHDRYRHFTVLGSKISMTYEPIGVDTAMTPVPTTAFINLAGANTIFGPGTEMSAINKLPYTKRASIVADQNSEYTKGKGIRLSATYSAKRFEGVRDVADNSQLKGEFSGVSPLEKAYFTVGVRNTIPTSATNDRMQQGIMRIKVEYIAKLTEPTTTNLVQETAGYFGTSHV